MKTRILALAKYVLYPIFYLGCLFSCLYLTFPWDKVKDRIEAEFARTQAAKGSRAWRLSIGSLDGYWISGVELENAKIIMPPDDEDADKDANGPVTGGALNKVTAAAKRNKAAADGADGEDGGDKAPTAKDKDKDADKEDAKAKKGPKESVVLIESAHARVRLLPLLIGRVKIDFQANVFGGEVKGIVPIGGGDLEVDIANVDVAQIAPLREVVGAQLKGSATGRLELSTATGKWNKATGALNLTITNMVMGDGKAKFRNLMTLPPANIGTFELVAKADAGVLKIEKFGSEGQDVELFGEGTIKLKEPWDASVSDLWLRFGFSEAYKHKDDRTEALFIDDGTYPALISQDRKLKRAKRADGLWGFHIHGKLSRLKYDPTTADGPKGSKTTTEPAKKTKKTEDDDDDMASPTPTPRPGVTTERPPTIKRPIPTGDDGSPVPAPAPNAPEPQDPTPEPAPAPAEPDGQEPVPAPQEDPAPAP